MASLAVSIPTYNRADILADRLMRMSRMQQRMNIEISISDNASTDHTRDVVEQFRKSFSSISYVRQREPVSPNINFFTALRNTTFPYVTQIGDDDTIFEEGMLQALEILDAEPELQAVLGNCLNYDFAIDRPIDVQKFVEESRRLTLDQVDAEFPKFYFFEYIVSRRQGIDEHFYNEGLSHPIGWKLILANLLCGPVRLETVPLICKGKSFAQWGFQNHRIEFQDFVRSDPEWYAARRIPYLSDELRTSVARAAMMHTVRFSSDSTVNANEQKQYLTALHHAQKAAAYNYDTRDYPPFSEADLVLGRLAEWCAAIFAGAPQIQQIVSEDHPVCIAVMNALRSCCPQIKDWTVVAQELLQASASHWVITFEYSQKLADTSLQSAVMTYVSLLDVLKNSADTPQQLAHILHIFSQQSIGKPYTQLGRFIDEWEAARLPLISADLTGGTAIASSDGFGSPDRAFDGDSETFWVSAERGEQIKDNAWIGYAFAEPQVVRRICVVQTTNPPFRQNLVRVERSADGGQSWTAVSPEPFPLTGKIGWINLPTTEPATHWRLVAADDAISANAWTVVRLSFLTLETADSGFITPDLTGGMAIASSDGFGSPDRAFDGDSETFWVSAERGEQIKDNAWIGYAFAEPQVVRRICVVQTTNPPFRQNLVRVERSADGGQSWTAVSPEPFPLTGKIGWINLPTTEPATHWRLMAADNSATSRDHAWSPSGITFYISALQQARTA